MLSFDSIAIKDTELPPMPDVIPYASKEEAEAAGRMLAER